MDGIQKWLVQEDRNPKRIRITIEKENKRNSFFFENGVMTLATNGLAFQNSEELETCRNIRPESLFSPPPVRKIVLLVPTLPTDRRWKSLPLPASSLFLGSVLLNNHFQVTVEKLDLRLLDFKREWLDHDLVGLSLYEDLFPEISRWLAAFRPHFSGLLAGGGPMVTLNPFQTAFHAPQLNLLIRGEAEFAFPDILTAINEQDVENLLNYQGFLYHSQGLIIISELHHINRPRNLGGFHFNTRLLSEHHLGSGIETNLSRGCKQGCIFCSKPQGRKIRKLPVEEFDRLLLGFHRRLESHPDTFSGRPTLNINDDDILQDTGYVRAVFRSIKKHRFKIYGVQSSARSFFNRRQKIREDLMKLISDPRLFVNNQPLVWLGTDAFLKSRGKKLGKWVPDQSQLEILVQEFEGRGIKNYHYWISSDYLSNWPEFIKEFLFIADLKSRYPHFGLLPHSPFLIPYSSTPLFTMLAGHPGMTNRIRYREVLKSRAEIFNLPLAERVETPYTHLNKLLKNESDRFLPGFFDALRCEDHLSCLKTVYYFLKLERLWMENLGKDAQTDMFRELEAGLEKRLSSLAPENGS